MQRQHIEEDAIGKATRRSIVNYPLLQSQMHYEVEPNLQACSAPCQIRIRGSPGIRLPEIRSPVQPNVCVAMNTDSRDEPEEKSQRGKQIQRRK
jgi:hypothetical protein